MAPPSDLLDKPSYILSIPHIPAVESCILGHAIRSILLGHVDAARKFIELYHSRPTLQKLEFVGLRALVPYWRRTRFPKGTPDRMKTEAYFDDYVHSKQQQGLQWPFYVPKDQRTEDEAGITALMNPGPNRPGVTIKPARPVALDLAIKLAGKQGFDPSHDTKVLDILATIARHFPNRWERHYLVESPDRVSLFMSGALAKIWGLSDQELDTRAAEILEACRERYWRDPSIENPATVSELLQSCNNDSVTKDDTLEDEAERPTSLYKPPATEQDILALEQRLGVNLPDDFKAFLHTSNGFGGIWNGFFPGPPLRSIEEIDWLDYTEYELISDQLDMCWIRDYRTTTDDLPEPPIFTNVICIASEDIDDIWLIPPPLVQQMRENYKQVYDLVNEEGKAIIERAVNDFAGSWHEWENLEWNCVTWASGGSACLNQYKSFKAWLETAAWVAKNTVEESD
ncbi:hypothetical protein E4T44_04991 [Aureobasidium sp. EXF-8845]|nr:hypothetical protein E4T44_04991 [Aureobasidium sp. EXF-8845]KAI4851921.1 hypothetical protein E4T45_04896 [Aureobasidium sp. EXF-8846]